MGLTAIKQEGTAARLFTVYIIDRVQRTFDLRYQNDHRLPSVKVSVPWTQLKRYGRPMA